MPKRDPEDDGGQPTKRPKITVIKNEYFSNFEQNGVSHRRPEQLWNVAYQGRTLVIYLQATGLKSKGFDIDDTTFGKKHMMSFAGGKADSTGKGDFMAKMMRVTEKRQTHVPTSQKTKFKKGNIQGLPDNLRARIKYGIFGQNGKAGNSIIYCDMMSPQELKEAFAEALFTGQGGKAIIHLPGTAVFNVANGQSTPLPVGADGSVAQVTIGYSQIPGQDWFAVKHLESVELEMKD